MMGRWNPRKMSSFNHFLVHVCWLPCLRKANIASHFFSCSYCGVQIVFWGSLKDMVEVLIFGMYLLYGYDQFKRRCFYVTFIISFEYQVVVFGLKKNIYFYIKLNLKLGIYPNKLKTPNAHMCKFYY